MNDLIRQCENLPIALARRYQRRTTLDFEDLVAEGNLGLVEAAVRYDASRGVTFATFAYSYIRGYILNAINKARKLREHERLLGSYEIGTLRQVVQSTEPGEETIGRFVYDRRLIYQKSTEQVPNEGASE